MSSHVLPPPAPVPEDERERPTLWVIDDDYEQELDVFDVVEDGSSLTSTTIRKRFADQRSMDAAVALCGVPTGDSISRSSFSGVSTSQADDALLGDLFHITSGRSGEGEDLYGNSGSNRLRECNRVNTAQMVASVRFLRRRRMQNIVLGASALVSFGAMVAMMVV